jgi:hypothetical protein
MKREWKNIEDYEKRYAVSNEGYVKSFIRYKLLKPFKNKKGYLCVTLCEFYNKEYRRVHRLVAEAFLPNPKNKPEINHKDGNKENNRVDNLEWVTCSENMKHRRNKLGINLSGSKNGSAKLTEHEVRIIKYSNLPFRKLSKIFNIHESHVYRIKQGFKWSHIRWKG